MVDALHPGGGAEFGFWPAHVDQKKRHLDRISDFWKSGRQASRPLLSQHTFPSFWYTKYFDLGPVR